MMNSGKTARRAPLAVLWLTLVVVTGRVVRFQNTRNYVRSFTNGPGGECEIYTATHQGIRTASSEVICESRWIGNGSVTPERGTLAYKRGCRYYKKTSTYLCYGTELGKSGPVTCTKRVTYYMIKPECADAWLEWEKCDKPCGGGQTTRVKFSKNGSKYERMTDHRSCNTHECPHWGPWKPKQIGNDTIPCNVATCTRIWERDCIYNNTITQPTHCAGDNSSHERETACPVQECVGVKITSQTADHGTNLTIATVLTDAIPPGRNITSNTPIAFEYAVVAGDPVGGNSNIWIGFGIGFLATASVFFVAFLVKRRWLRGKARTHRQKKFGSAITNNITDEFVFEGATTPFRLERIRSPGVEEGIYCTVLQQQAGRATGHNEMTEERSAVGENPTDTSDVLPDPLYSDIPAFEGVADAELYSSSEFESMGEESDIGGISSLRTSSETSKENNLPPIGSDAAEDGCKSFDSDESRDVVHTLRRDSTKSKKSPLGCNGLEEVFLSDEEVAKEDHYNDRKFAFSRRYSKLLAKKARKSLSRKGNQPVEAGFQWIEGRRWTTSTNSDCSTHSQSRVQDSENARCPRRLSLRSSLGECSMTSCNLDATTSGYNSGIGESTDDEHSRWVNGRMSRSQTPARRWKSDRNRSHLLHRGRHQSLTTNSLYATERRSHVDVHPNGSPFDKIMPRPFDADHMVKLGRQSPAIRPYMTARPSFQRSVSLISRNGRVIPVEDIYSSPVDADVQNIEETPFGEYDLPIDAIRSKSVLS